MSKRRKCREKGCRNPQRRDGNTLCAKHAQRVWRARSPMRAAFATLRDHARARGIPFTIEPVQFECFCKLSGYIEGKANTAEGLTVDRIDNLKGYVPGNIQAMTRRRNSEKQARQDERRMRAGYGWNGGSVPGETPWEYDEPNEAAEAQG